MAVREKRMYPRTKANWTVEVRGISKDKQAIREVSKIEDYSRTGACVLSMSEVELGSKVQLKIKPGHRAATPVAMEGEVVRIDENADVGHMFRALGIRWNPADRSSVPENK